ncbi:MAG: alanine/glycine:cation symporter family protein [Fusobacteriaceae bacterium]
MGLIEKIVEKANFFMWEKNILVVMLVGSALYFTWKTKFIQIRFLKNVGEILFRKQEEGNDKGITPFQSFCLGTACRVGAGNVVGVVAAISIGGPGSIFWMWLVAFLGSSTAFVESVLAVIYRDGKGGKYRGGTPWIIEKKTGSKKFAMLFALSSILCYFGVTQVMANTITSSLKMSIPSMGNWIAYLLTALTALLLLGKKDKIIGFLNTLVPIMAGLYLMVSFFIILKNAAYIPGVFREIVLSAFGIGEAVGGTVGGALMLGIKRGLFSNEAGSGNSTYAAAVSEVDHPAEQGMVQMLGVFVDTLLICSATALVILLGKGGEGLTGVALFQNAMVYHLGWVGKPFVTLILFLFSFSTILGVAFYGKTALAYFTQKKNGLTVFNLLMIAMVFMGGTGENYFVWSLADLGLGLMTIFNLSCIIPLGGEAVAALEEYEAMRGDAVYEKNKSNPV